MKITHQYFLDEFNKFRDIMCSTEFTRQQKELAFQGLLRVYINREFDNKKNEELAQSAMDMLLVEFPMRMAHEPL